MTPEQALKIEAMQRLYESEYYEGEKQDLSVESIQLIWDQHEGDGDLDDIVTHEMREGDEETGIESEWSRHLESKSVAMKLRDGAWVGWTYWFGGGKHAEPEAVEWMSDAYFLDVKTEMRPVNTFTKRDAD